MALSLTCDECGCFPSRHDDFCSQWTEPADVVDEAAPIPYVLWNVDGEQYRVIIRGKHVATYIDVEAAADAYTDMACVHCWQPRNGPRAPLKSDCCDVQTWRREAQS